MGLGLWISCWIRNTISWRYELMVSVVLYIMDSYKGGDFIAPFEVRG